MKRSSVAALGLVGVLGLLPAVAGAGGSSPARPDRAKTTEVQILALNDFHGQLEVVDPNASSGGRIGPVPSQGGIPAGGVEYLATHVRNLRAENPKNTIFVSAGDLIGATPLLSALFHDEPTIEAFNEIGLDYNGVGNHEFDEGVDELLRMQYGSQLGGDGCHPEDGCGDGDPYHGAEFDFLAANVAYKDSGDTIFPPYAIHHFQGVKVAVVGMTLEGTPTIVTPAGIASVDFLDEAASVNALVPELKRQNIETIVVLLHEGGSVGDPLLPSTINSCNSPSGPLPPIVEAMDDEIDVVVTGHTNWAVNCIIDGKIVTGAASQGRLITDIDLTVSRATKEVVGATVNNRIVTQNVPRAADMTALMAEYQAVAGPIGAREIGVMNGAATRTNNAAGESQLGDIIADAQLAGTAGEGAQIAFMNPGGIRADLNAGPVTYAEAFAVQPFSNIVVTMDLTGAQIEGLLEQQFCGRNADGSLNTSRRVLQVSEGFTYTWDTTPVDPCDRVDPATIRLDGVTIDPATTYRVTVNSFLATGGDAFSILNDGTNRVFGDDDLVVLEAYFAAAGATGVDPGPQNRISII